MSDRDPAAILSETLHDDLCTVSHHDRPEVYAAAMRGERQPCRARFDRIAARVLAALGGSLPEPTPSRGVLTAALDVFNRISKTEPRRPAHRGMVTSHEVDETHSPENGCDICFARTFVIDAIRLAATPESDGPGLDAERLTALRAIHVPVEGLRRLHPRTSQPTDHICDECDRPWPCATFEVLTAARLGSENTASDPRP
jgi:hypothetical protein